MQMTIKITGDKELIKKLSHLRTSMYDFRGAMAQIGKEGAQYFATQAFLSQGGVFGNNWPALSPRYAAQKARRFPGRPPLVATGRMQRGYVFRAGRTEVNITNEAPQFVYHQSSAPRTKIPRRQTIGVNNPLKRMVRDIIRADMRKKLRTM